MFKFRKHLKDFKSRCLVSNLKKSKEANCIVVGGMTSAGKSTLVNKIAQELNFDPVFELSKDKNDLTNILLEKMHKRDEVVEAVCQLHLFINGFEKYKKAMSDFSNKKIKVFDRSLLENRLFAYNNLIDQPNVYEYYEKIWQDKVNELIYSIGAPKLYIILKINWKTFKKRVFLRNRLMEVKNFKKNEEYYHFLLIQYEKYLTNICKNYSIPYVVIDVNHLNTEEVFQKAKKILKQYKIIN